MLVSVSSRFGIPAMLVSNALRFDARAALSGFEFLVSMSCVKPDNIAVASYL